MNQVAKISVFVIFTIIIFSIPVPVALAQPDVYVTDIYTPTSLVALQTFIVTVELFNYGTDGTVPLSMYIDGIYKTIFYKAQMEE